MKNTLETTGNGISVAGGITWVWAMMHQIDWLTVTGILVAVGGFLMNFHYSRKKDKREEADMALRLEQARQAAERHEIQMAEMRAKLNACEGKGNEDEKQN